MEFKEYYFKEKDELRYNITYIENGKNKLAFIKAKDQNDAKNKFNQKHKNRKVVKAEVSNIQ